MKNLPNNPEKIPEHIRKNEGDSELEVLKDIRQELDTIRRNMEYSDGGVKQKDKSKKDEISIPANGSETITLEAGENEFLYVAQAGVKPPEGDITILMDDEETNSNIDYRVDQKKVNRKVEIIIENTSSNEKSYNYFIDAKAVKVRN